MRLFAAVLLAFAVAAPPAEAGLTVCNKSKHAARVALGRYNGHDWMSEGWWTIAPANCTDLIASPLDARYYYLYGTDTASGVWDGAKIFCIAPADKFSIVGRADCARRGYDRKRFFQIDTNDKLNQTQTLQ